MGDVHEQVAEAGQPHEEGFLAFNCHCCEAWATVSQLCNKSLNVGQPLIKSLNVHTSKFKGCKQMVVSANNAAKSAACLYMCGDEGQVVFNQHVS